jgi:hypothetical protein
MTKTESMSDAAFEVVTLVPGLSELKKRTGELDGNLPVRAARYCGPVFEGSAAGFQITLAQPMNLARSRGNVHCIMTEPTLKQVTEEVDDALERGVKAKLLTRGGYWHRLFRGNALPVRGNRVLFWTGHLIRPRREIWVLVGGAYNRRSRVSVIDHVASDPEHYVPLVLEIDAREIGRRPVWLEAEIGCVTPLVPAVRMRKKQLAPGDTELHQFANFFSDEYFETKARHPTAAYVRRQRENRVRAEPACDARLLYVGPDVHVIQEFARFVTTKGFARTPSSLGTLQYGIVRNIARVRWNWQGQTHESFEVDKQHRLPALESLWRATFGDGKQSGLEFLRGHFVGEVWDQPYVQLQPWVFAPTATGWSSLVDGFHRTPAYDGMRAVIATDWFFSLAMVFRIFGPSKAAIPVRAPLLRTIPVTRAALALGMKSSTLT